MDPASVATMAMTMLNPYFVAAATSVATEAGKDVYEHSKHLFEFILSILPTRN